ncbi:N-6 DNA methylase [Alloscardovia omnicolens]|uniref:N-6 DNA methylase n=1 Tax=Alloscardovia omnicolens TaxID=419015 RepID=UPI0023AA1DB4|nr:N-6 DNA methylase [Alloscardovia omnicolens]
MGRFYGEFMHYSDADDQSLGIILAPHHITDLMCDLVDIIADDVVLDPTCRIGGFLISAMHKCCPRLPMRRSGRILKRSSYTTIKPVSNSITVARRNLLLHCAFFQRICPEACHRAR